MSHRNDSMASAKLCRYSTPCNLLVVPAGFNANNKYLGKISVHDELGVKNADVTSWFGILVPRETPRSIIESMRVAFKAISDEPSFRKQVEQQGMEVTYCGPKTAAIWNAEIGKWQGVIRSARIVLQ